jgi:hypothetical protein
MKKKRFASYLLAGKAATLPFAINSSHADVYPYYTDILTSKVSLIEQPTTGVKLMTIASSASSYSPYSSTAYSGGNDAAVCNNPMPSVMNVVITGVKQGDTIYLVAATDKDSPTYLAIDNRLRVGTTNQVIISAFRANGTPLIGDDGSAMNNSTTAISIPVDLNKLKNAGVLNNGRFYLQAALFPTLSGANVWAQARLSELDEVSVGSAGCSSTYATSSPYGSTY